MYCEDVKVLIQAENVSKDLRKFLSMCNYCAGSVFPRCSFARRMEAKRTVKVWYARRAYTNITKLLSKVETLV